MNQRPPDVPSEADMPNRRKVQRIASAALYAVMVALAIWVIRDFVPAIAWACVIAIALWPAFHRIEEHRLFKGRSTLIATVLTIAIGLLFLLPVGIGIAQAAAEAHDVIEWARDVQENGIPLPDFVQHLPFGAAQIGAWWQDNLTQPLRDSPAMKGLHGGAVVTFGRHFGARAAHALMLFGFMLVTLFVIFQAGPKLSGELMKGVRRAFGYDGMHLAERMAAAARGTARFRHGDRGDAAVLRADRILRRGALALHRARRARSCDWPCRVWLRRRVCRRALRATGADRQFRAAAVSARAVRDSRRRGDVRAARAIRRPGADDGADGAMDRVGRALMRSTDVAFLMQCLV
jgi:hypothetical protein